VDGELKGLRRWLMQRHVNACPICAAEYRHQQRVRQMLRDTPPVAVIGDSPEFFWSKVKREIQRRGDERVETPMSRPAFVDWVRQHQLVAATAAVFIVVILIIPWFVNVVPNKVAVTASVPRPAAFAKVEQLKTPVPHTAATSFDSDDADVTVIWVSGLPWTPDMNEMKTEFANLDT
jgi:anti-sigma factor RsiW